ncbi:MAG: YlmC/YmxH family sporulation protein [Clostridia bacterium]|nr:YlmC/YmxH family sporulation protein [Clostridia bacterium]
METSYLEIRCKEVVNIVDGRKLGHIVDVVFDLSNGCLLGLVVPGEKSFWNVFKSGTEIFISLNQIVKVGEDTILVELNSSPNTTYLLSSNKKK